MADLIKNLKNHGRETYAVYYGDEFVLKRPLPTFNDAAKKCVAGKTAQNEIHN